MKITQCRGLRLSRPAAKLWRSTWFHNPLQNRSSLHNLFSWGRRRLTSDSGTVPLLQEGKPTQPPKGHLVVYVVDSKDDGRTAVPRRYVVPVVYFNHPLFGELLTEAEEEFGHDQPGGITIPCPVAKFERVKNRIAAGGRGKAGKHQGNR